MSNSKSSCVRGFHHLSRSWYGASILADMEGVQDEITFGLMDPNGGTEGEMTMQWVDLGNRVVPKLTAFYDSWRVLAGFPDLIANLGEADGENISPEHFREMLKECGFTDLTKKINPQDDPKSSRVAAINEEIKRLSAEREALLG